MTSTNAPSHGAVKDEHGIQQDMFSIESAPLTMKHSLPVPNPKDLQNFLKQCSAFSKKTTLRCSARIAARTQNGIRLMYLPTCGAHRDQKSLAGWCQFKSARGETCGTLFRWTPPHFELCHRHQGHPHTPYYFLRQLPLELRNEIYRYLLPSQPIDSSTAAVHDQSVRETHQRAIHSAVQNRVAHLNHMPATHRPTSKFPIRLLDLLIVSRQVYAEVKHLLFSIVLFKIDVRKDGTFMGGRRLLEPKRADGSSHYFFSQADHAKKKFLKCFDWLSAKNYAVDILLENHPIANSHHAPNNVNLTIKYRWDREVEVYDIRVSVILAKAKKLNRLQVRLSVADFGWDEQQTLSNAKLLFSPFQKLRNVRQPELVGVFKGNPANNSMYPLERGTGRYPIETANGCMQLATPAYYELCSVLSLPTEEPVLSPGMPSFDVYVAQWTYQISSQSFTNMIQEPLIRNMFAQFRNFYTELAHHVPEITLKNGRHTLLHRARVAREQEDVIAFRATREELIEYWDRYLENQERNKRTMEAHVAKLLQSNAYPSHIWEDSGPMQEKSNLATKSAPYSASLGSEVLAKDGIPMTGNLVR